MKRFVLLSLGVLVAASAGGEVEAATATREELGPKEAAIDDAICADHARVDGWNTAWAVTFSLAAVTTAGLATFAPHDWFSSDARAGLYVTAGKATIGAVAKLVHPLEIDVGRLCEDHVATSAKARHKSLTEAAHEERGALLTNIVGGLALNSVSLFYLGFGRGAWENAWISFGVGAAVSVVSTFTAPTHSWLLKRRIEESHHVAAVPLLGGRSGGVALVATW